MTIPVSDANTLNGFFFPNAGIVKLLYTLKLGRNINVFLETVFRVDWKGTGTKPKPETRTRGFTQGPALQTPLNKAQQLQMVGQ